MITTITSKGQVTLPIEARRRLGLETGTRLEVLVTDDNHIEMVPLTHSLASLKGMAPKPKKRVSLKDMEAAIAEGATK